MIIDFKKIPNGLKWEGVDRTFTTDQLSSGHEIIDDLNMCIELDNQIFGIFVETAYLDGVQYATSTEFMNAIFIT